MAVSWWTVASNNPPRVLVCIGNKSLTSNLVTESKEFGLNLVGSMFKEKGLQCGLTTGRTTRKAEQFGIALVQGTAIKTSVVKDSIFTLECHVVDTFASGDHLLFLADVLAVGGSGNGTPLSAVEGYKRLEER